VCTSFDSPEGLLGTTDPITLLLVKRPLSSSIEKNKKGKKKNVLVEIHDAYCVYTIVYCTYIIIIIIYIYNTRVCVWRTVVGGGHVEPGQRDFYPSHSAHSPNSCTRLGSIPLYIMLYTLRSRSCVRRTRTHAPTTRYPVVCIIDVGRTQRHRHNDIVKM